MFLFLYFLNVITSYITDDLLLKGLGLWCFNQTLVEWSLDGPLPNLCPVIPISNQDGRQAKNRKKWG
jgi:hypothetical protein